MKPLYDKNGQLTEYGSKIDDRICDLITPIMRMAKTPLEAMLLGRLIHQEVSFRETMRKLKLMSKRLGNK